MRIKKAPENTAKEEKTLFALFPPRKPPPQSRSTILFSKAPSASSQGPTAEKSRKERESLLLLPLLTAPHHSLRFLFFSLEKKSWFRRFLLSALSSVQRRRSPDRDGQKTEGRKEKREREMSGEADQGETGFMENSGPIRALVKVPQDKRLSSSQKFPVWLWKAPLLNLLIMCNRYSVCFMKPW